MSKVAALYIDPRGPYPKLLGPEMCWDEARDARTYAGPWPVVAHPPCGPWGPWAHLCRTPSQDPTGGIVAFESVRIYGGVLEQPAASRLFDHLSVCAPHPREMADKYGGVTYEVDQCAWGHPCHKWTWIYAVRVNHFDLVAGIRKGGAPTHVMTHGPWDKSGLPEASKEIRRRTPVAFAEWLIALAAQAGRVAA